MVTQGINNDQDTRIFVYFSLFRIGEFRRYDYQSIFRQGYSFFAWMLSISCSWHNLFNDLGETRERIVQTVNVHKLIF